MGSGDQVTAALSSWRDAERRLTDATDGDITWWAQEVVERRAEYQRLVAVRAASAVSRSASDHDRAWAVPREGAAISDS
jgi:hypothetical protein